MKSKENSIKTLLDAISEFVDEGRKRDQKFIKTVGEVTRKIIDESIRESIKLSITEITNNLLNSILELDLCPDCRSKITKLKERLADKRK